MNSLCGRGTGGRVDRDAGGQAATDMVEHIYEQALGGVQAGALFHSSPGDVCVDKMECECLNDRNGSLALQATSTGYLYILRFSYSLNN